MKDIGKNPGSLGSALGHLGRESLGLEYRGIVQQRAPHPLSPMESWTRVYRGGPLKHEAEVGPLGLGDTCWGYKVEM